MPTVVKPEIGAWYYDSWDKRQFEVVAIDEASSTVEIQYFDGDIHELDYDVWFEMEILGAEAPEDWTGPFEIEGDDTGYTDIIIRPENWSDPFISLDNESFNDQLELFDEE